MGQKETKLVCSYKEAAGAMTTSDLHSIRQKWMDATYVTFETIRHFFETIRAPKTHNLAIENHFAFVNRTAPNDKMTKEEFYEHVRTNFSYY